MTFKSRYLSDKGLITFEFTVESVKDAISYLNEKESELNVPIRAYEVSSGCRIVGGKLEKTK